MGAKHGEFRELITEMFRERQKHPHLTVNLLRQHWRDILGQELAQKTYPARIAGNTLWINALDASWAYQLQFMKRELLESVQVFMGTQDLTELRFKQGGLHGDSGEAGAQHPAAPTGDMHPRNGAEQDGDSADEPVMAREEDPVTASVIPDEALRDSFSRWVHVKKRKKPAGS